MIELILYIGFFYALYYYLDWRRKKKYEEEYYLNKEEAFQTENGRTDETDTDHAEEIFQLPRKKPEKIPKSLGHLNLGKQLYVHEYFHKTDFAISLIMWIAVFAYYNFFRLTLGYDEFVYDRSFVKHILALIVGLYVVPTPKMLFFHFSEKIVLYENYMIEYNAVPYIKPKVLKLDKLMITKVPFIVNPTVIFGEKQFGYLRLLYKGII